MSPGRHGLPSDDVQHGAMDMDAIARFGPLAVALGAFAEGETALLLAGAGIALGMFDFWPVVLAAVAGSLAGDQFFFWLGRFRGAAFLSRHARFERLVNTANAALLRHRLLLLAGYRFIYGLRGAIPFAYGMSTLGWRTFLLANVLTAWVWSVLVTLAGLHAGQVLADPTVLTRLPLLFAGATIVVVAAILARRRFKSNL